MDIAPHYRRNRANSPVFRCLRWARDKHIGHDPRVHGLEIEADEEILKNSVACPLAPGGATIHLSRTMHYAGPNTSGVPRRAFIQTFGLPATPRTEPRAFPWNDRKRTAREERSKAARAAEGR